MINTIVNQIKDDLENGQLSYDGLKDIIAILSEIKKEKAKEKIKNISK